MKTWNGMITNYADIETIKKNGTPCKIEITWTKIPEVRDGYEYEGKRYTVELDRDGWPIAWEHK